MIKKLSLGLFFSFVALCIIAVVFRIRLGFDPQVSQCLPFSVAVVRLVPPAVLKRGEVVVFVTHNEMGHGFDGRAITKLVAGMPGDSYRVSNDQFYVNGRLIGKLDLVEKLRKKAGAFDREGVVPAGQFLPIGTMPRAYDSRYWGPVPQSEIIGQAWPIDHIWNRHAKTLQKTAADALGVNL